MNEKVEQLEKVLDGKERMLVKMNETVSILKKVKEELQSEKQERMGKCDQLQAENKQLIGKVHQSQLRTLHYKRTVFILVGLLLVCGVVLWRVLG